MRKLVLILVFLLNCNVFAEVITVDDDGPADFNNIQDAINYSWHGDTIIISSGN